MRPAYSQTSSVKRHWALLVGIAAAGLVLGCSRSHYRRSADSETLAILDHRSESTPWQLPPGFTIEPDPRSRLFDPSDPDDPALPLDVPRLYSYQIPELQSDRQPPVAPAADEGPGLGEARSSAENGVQLASATAQPDRAGEPRSNSSSTAEETGAQSDPVEAAADPTAGMLTSTGERQLPVIPIPATFWYPIPDACLARMFEFASVREQYKRTFGAEPDASLRDASRKLTLENIVELALLNSREYQTQRERLYQVALTLTLERFDYDLKFAPVGNGVDVDYTHTLADARTVDTLQIPSSFQVDKMLATGGNLLARFANDVVLTFDPPNGIASEISSELLFRVTQTVFQRDMLLNPLIQAERDVVYAARDFARFRKVFFFQLANTYYDLVLTYRRIEIESQNYFSLVQNLNQRQAEARAGIAAAQSPIQIDQIEQQVLGGRRALISTCNSLEQGLDRLKIVMGLPTETPLNLDLSELEELTLSDEVEVDAELVRRALRRLESIRSTPVDPLGGEVIDSSENQAEALNASIVLIQRLELWLELRERRGHPDSDRKELQRLGAVFFVAEARLAVEQSRLELAEVRQSDPPAPPIQVIQRVLDLAEALNELVDRQVGLVSQHGAEQARLAPIAEASRRIRLRLQEVREQFAAGLLDEQFGQLDDLLRQAEALLTEAETVADESGRLADAVVDRQRPDDELGVAFEQLRQRTESLLVETEGGLRPVDLSVDQAMATALMQRLDLMNERGFVADDWRDVKIAADDLRSVLNLNAEQSIRTRRNRPFGFTFDESRTQLSLSLDLPLNRKAQRNSFRRALINFQASLRALASAEDEIKFDVRDDQRNIDLRRVQYEISVASAGLAAVRVLSTELELALGIENVGARDFLEAQDAYREALVAVASDHIDYITARAQLFLDLELMVVDAAGFWPEIRNEAVQPVFNQQYPWDAGPLYGEIPEFLRVSCDIERMLCVPHPRGPLELSPEAPSELDGAGPSAETVVEPMSMVP